MEKIDINFIEEGKCIHYHEESSFVPRKDDFIEIYGKEWQVDYVKWVIHQEDGLYAKIYLKPVSMEG